MNALTTQPGLDRAELLGRLRELVDCCERGDDTGFESRFASLVAQREQGLFVSVARLTRSLHDAVRELSLDDRLAVAADSEIPDACSRLDYVTQVTEEAAHKTLDLVEVCKKLTQDITTSTQDLHDACTRAHRYSGSPYALSGLVILVDEVAIQIAHNAQQLRERLTAVAQAQEYQDLAGQVIRRVTRIVRGVESALIELLRASGGMTGVRTQDVPVVTSGELLGPAVPGVTPQAVSQTDADALLAELGF